MTKHPSVTLSASTAAALDALAERFGLTRAEMIERLITGNGEPAEKDD